MPTRRGTRQAAKKEAQAICGLLWSEFCSLTGTTQDAPPEVAMGLCARHLAEHGNPDGAKCCAAARGVMLVADELGQLASGGPYLSLIDGATDAKKALQSLIRRLDEYLPLATESHERAAVEPGWWHECGEACERPKRIRDSLPGLIEDLDQLRHFLPACFTGVDLSQSPLNKPRPMLRWNVAITLQQGGYSLRDIARLIAWNPDQEGIEDRVAKLLARYS
jgi:hypothetical protein